MAQKLTTSHPNKLVTLGQTGVGSSTIRLSHFVDRLKFQPKFQRSQVVWAVSALVNLLVELSLLIWNFSSALQALKRLPLPYFNAFLTSIGGFQYQQTTTDQTNAFGLLEEKFAREIRPDSILTLRQCGQGQGRLGKKSHELRKCRHSVQIKHDTKISEPQSMLKITYFFVQTCGVN